MNSQSRYVYELAGESDGNELLEILEEQYFEGGISLLYTRRPDAYKSFLKEGKDVKIVVLRDRKNDKIAGFGVCAIREMFINGSKEDVGYLFSLRGRREYVRRVPLLHKGYEFLRGYVPNIRFFYTTILEENTYAIRMLEKRRDFMPAYIYLGKYTVLSIKTRKIGLPPGFSIRRCDEVSVGILTDFLNGIGRNYQFYPVFREDDLLKGEFYGLGYEDFYMVFKDGNLVGAFAIWDQRDYKQYVVKGYRGIYRILRRFSPIIELFGYPKLPRVGETLRFFYLSFLTARKPEVIDVAIRCAMNLTDYDFFSIGFFEKNDLSDYLKRYRGIRYRSNVYLVDWDGYYEEFDKDAPIYLECGLL